MARRSTMALFALALASVGFLGLWFGSGGRESEGRALATNAVDPKRSREDGLEGSDLAEIATAALRQDLMTRRTRGETTEEAEARRAQMRPIDLTDSETALSPEEARKRTNELIATARLSRKVIPEDASRIVDSQRQMSEADFDESVRQFQDLLNSPNVDSSEL